MTAVVADIDWAARRQAIALQVADEYKANPDSDSNTKRKLYSELELLRMDYTEQRDVAAYLHELEHSTDKAKAAALADTPVGRAITDHIKDFDALRAKLAIPHGRRTNKLRVIAKLIAAILYSAIAFPVLLLLMPIRLLHPAFRAIGITNNNLPTDVLQRMYGRAILACAGVHVRYEGLEHTAATAIAGAATAAADAKTGIAVNASATGATVGMFTHASNWDSFIVTAGPLSFKWIAKKILFFVPFIGWLMYGWGHIPIDRSNRTKAISSLNEAVNRIRKWGRSICVSPEGTRSKTGRLGDFKKGPFHTAVQVGLPITPILSFGAYESWPPGQVFGDSADVVVRYLPRIEVLKEDTPHTLLVRVRRAILKGLAEPLESSKVRDIYDPRVALAFFPVILAMLWPLWKHSF